MKKRRQFEHYLVQVVSKEKKGLFPALLLGLLSMLEIVYLALLKLNRFMVKSRRLPAPVISVGNIVVGGTGKTPTVVWLVNLLKKAGFTPAVLTRGYGAARRDEGLVFDDSLLQQLTPEATGDEPYLLAGLLPGTVIGAGRDRYRMGLKILAMRPEVDVLVMDDGFQHLKLKRDLDIVILDAAQPFGNEHLIPRGTLREPPAGLKRAGLVLLTRTAKAAPETLRKLIAYLQKLKLEPVGIVREEHTELIPLSRWQQKKPGIPASDFLKGRRIAAITGIGNPRQFLASLETLGAEVGYFKAYPDHYVWEEKEIENLIDTLKDWGFQDMVITVKDGVKLVSFTEKFSKTGLNCFMLSLEYVVDDPVVFRTIMRILPESDKKTLTEKG